MYECIWSSVIKNLPLSSKHIFRYSLSFKNKDHNVMLIKKESFVYQCFIILNFIFFPMTFSFVLIMLYMCSEHKWFWLDLDIQILKNNIPINAT